MATVRGSINRTVGVGRAKYKTAGGKFTSRAGKQRDLNKVFGAK